MIFVGSLDKGYFAEEVSNKLNLSFDYVQEAAHISEPGERDSFLSEAGLYDF